MTADLGLQPARARDIETIPVSCAADDQMRDQRLGLALERQRFGRHGPEEGRNRPARRRPDHDLIRVRPRSNPSAGVHRVARDRVNAAARVAAGDQYEARVDPAVHTQRTSQLRFHAGADFGHALVQHQASEDRPNGIVVVRGGHPEEHHHLVTDDLVEQSPMLLGDPGCFGADRLHLFDHLFRIDRLVHRRVARQVGENDGRHSAFAGE